MECLCISFENITKSKNILIIEGSSINKISILGHSINNNLNIDQNVIFINYYNNNEYNSKNYKSTIKMCGLDEIFNEIYTTRHIENAEIIVYYNTTDIIPKAYIQEFIESYNPKSPTRVIISSVNKPYKIKSNNILFEINTNNDINLYDMPFVFNEEYKKGDLISLEIEVDDKYGEPLVYKKNMKLGLGYYSTQINNTITHNYKFTVSYGDMIYWCFPLYKTNIKNIVITSTKYGIDTIIEETQNYYKVPIGNNKLLDSLCVKTIKKRLDLLNYELLIQLLEIFNITDIENIPIAEIEADRNLINNCIKKYNYIEDINVI